MTKLQDKLAITQVLAGLMKHPERTSSKAYDLSTDDFVEKMHQIIFGAITNLYTNEAKKITILEIDAYLQNYTEQYRIFNENDGIEYLEAIQEFSVIDNFDMHYQRVKKFTFLRECKKIGIDISDIYNEKLVDLAEEEERNKRFDKMTLTDMVKHVELKIILIKEQFLSSNTFSGGHISENVQEIIDAKEASPSFGAPQASLFLNTIFRGSRKRKFNLKHGNTGGGKSRFGMANMAAKTIPEIWDNKENKWIKTGANKHGLIISTELDEEEIKLPFVAYIANVDESLIHEKKLTHEEKVRVEKAVTILEKSSLWFEVLSDFDIEDIETTIIKHINLHDVEFIEFDYIHTSLKLLSALAQKGARNLREDQILLIIAISLKDLCNKYDIHIESATQLNDNQNKDDNMDQSWIRGSKALADKIDGGYILLEIRPKDQKLIDAVYKSGKMVKFAVEPNISLNVYKSRGGKWKRIRVFGHFNTGTLRFQDLFCINYNGELISEIELKTISFNEPSGTEISKLLYDNDEDELPEFAED
ncbi:DnaB-like helicase C-terminal domain-containing protein [Solibacillus sp. FSL H8-0523]|uniref:DnaB-like helicase C-terminal domain-containing protein n=1 Tax=Solibacillus sp. FSL H8-0523 TaxID=2954511 RepID=UPI003100DB9A